MSSDGFDGYVSQWFRPRLFDAGSDHTRRVIGVLTIATIGLVSGCVFVAELIDKTAPFVSRLLSGYSILFSALLLGGARWLLSDDAPSRPLRVAGWSLAGTVLLFFAELLLLLDLTAVVTGSVVAIPDRGYAHVAVIGAVAGFLLGVYDVDRLEKYENEATTRRRLEALLESSINPILVLDDELCVQRLNPAAEQLFGWTEGELLGERPPMLSAAELERAIDAPRGIDRSSFSDVVTTETKAGEMLEVRQSVTPVRDEGALVGYMAVVENVTDRVRQKRALERNREILERTQTRASVGGWEYDLLTEEVFWTDGTRAIFEVSDDFEPTLGDAIGFYREADRGELEAAVERCRETGVPYDIELRLVTQRGRERWTRTRGEAVTKGDTIVALRGTIQDVTEQKQREQQLTVLHRLFRHNIRNNLNVVIGRAELLLESLGGDEPAGEMSTPRPQASERESLRQRESIAPEFDGGSEPSERPWSPSGSAPLSTAEVHNHLQSIVRQAEELVSIGNKTASYDDVITPGNQHQRAVAVRPLLDELRSEYRAEYSTAHIEVSCPDSAIVHGDPKLLHMALDELVSNTIEHAGDTSPVVELESFVPVDERVVIRVRDNGPGLSDYERRVATTGDETPLIHSNGVGLWLVNWLVTRLGGTVRFEDNDPRGAVVTLVLPATDEWV